MPGFFKTKIQEQMVSQVVIDQFHHRAAKLLSEERVSANEADLFAAGRDFWPVCNIWMLEGRVPALPQLVVWPENKEEVVKLLQLANELSVPVAPFGEGSGTLGGVLPLFGGVTIDLKKMNRLVCIDETNLIATVESGMNGELYEKELNRAGYTGGHFPQSLRCSSVGGWLACRAAGQFSTRYGKIEDIVLSLTAVLPDGTIISGPLVPRASTGPRLDHLFLGSEGIFGVITSANLKIWPCPEKRFMDTFTFAELSEGLEAIRLFMRAGARPAVVRLYDAQETGHHFPALGDKRCGLIILLEGNETITTAERQVIRETALRCGAEEAGEEHVLHWLKTRFDVSVASMLFQKGAVLDTIEVSANWHNAYSTYKAMQNALMATQGTMLATGHYSHVYPQGAALYLTVVGFPGSDPVGYYKKIWQAAMTACLSEGASIGHHHGIGLNRGQWMQSEHGPALDLLKRVKKAFDEQEIMNPGKLGLKEVSKWP